MGDALNLKPLKWLPDTWKRFELEALEALASNYG